MRLLSILAPLVLAGCSSLPAGVTMTDAERAACAAQTCTVWTDQELQGLAMQVFREGFTRGAQSSGRAL
jgi:hypothetical protein